VASPWTVELTDHLKLLWTAGLSCSQIAAQLPWPFTRNAIIGRVHRLNLEGRAVNNMFKKSSEHHLERIRLKNERRRERRAEFKPEAISRGPRPIICLEVNPRNISLSELQDGECRWPEGDGPAYTFCGTPVFEESSYCAGHYHSSIGRGTASERWAGKVSETQIVAF
jgi:GcrA cell cycle regulator